MAHIIEFGRGHLKNPFVGTPLNHGTSEKACSNANRRERQKYEKILEDKRIENRKKGHNHNGRK
jgi:hypothetical protein